MKIIPKLLNIQPVYCCQLAHAQGPEYNLFKHNTPGDIYTIYTCVRSKTDLLKGCIKSQKKKSKLLD